MFRSLSNRVAAGLTLAALLLVPFTRAAARDADKASARLDAIWADLASADEAKALRAALALAAAPRESVRFLKDRLKPVKVDARAVGKQIARLDSDDFTEREKAAEELEYLGKSARPLLEKARDDSQSLEVKKRLQDLLEKFPSDKPMPPPPPPKLQGRSVSVINRGGDIQIIIDGKPLDLSALVPPPPLPTGPSPAWKRAARAVSVLEQIGTAEARQLIESIAGGEEEAFPTRSAKEALERLKK